VAHIPAQNPIILCQIYTVELLPYAKNDDLCREIGKLRHGFQFSGYPQAFIVSVINSKGSTHPNKKEMPISSVYIPYVKGISEKLKHTGNYYIRTIFRTKHNLRSSLVRTRLEWDPQQMTHCSIPSKCGRSYINKTGRTLTMWLPEHRHNLKGSFLEKPKLCQHACEEGQGVLGWR
jgi:hypothetical protein